MGILKNKVAIITGGGAGIGKATAEIFLKEGAKVMLVDWKEADLIKTVRALKSPKLKYIIADVSKEADVKRFTRETLNEFGKIDIYFSNAGIEGVVAPISAYPVENFEKVIAINLKGVWLGCKHVIPQMEEGGSVIITSSVAGLQGFANLSAYVASKHGVVGIMRVAAIESAPRKIRVNSVHPGPINNRMMRSIEKLSAPDNPNVVKEGFEATVPLKRYGESEEIAQVVLFLASDQSSYVTGATYVADGGMLVG